MPDTPTPAPALTDEEMAVNLTIIRDCAASLTRAVSAPSLVDRTIAAVVARAKREAAEEIAGELEAAATGMGDDLDDYGRGLRNGFRLAARRAEGGATR